MKRVIFFNFVLLLIWPGYNELHAQEGQSNHKTLTEYIQIGLNNNLSLQEKQFNLQKSYFALQEAKSYFLPTISFHSDFSMAKGGRSVDLPLGDLMNPVFSSLNKLNASDDFNMVQNQNFALIPTKFQDTKFQITMPLVNKEIRYFNLIKREIITEKRAEVNVYKRELIKDIKVAYYSFLQAQKFIEIYKNANLLLLENIRYTEVLIKNSLGLKSNLLKVQGQLAKNKALLTEAENKSKAAAAYFNFLINTQLESPISIDSSTFEMNCFIVTNTISADISGRDELGLLQSMRKQSVLLIKMEKSTWTPQISTYLNVGTQGSNYNISQENNYFLGGLQLKWNIFNGYKTKNRVKQAEKDVQILELKIEETTQKIELEKVNKLLELNSAIARLTASKSNQQFAFEIYRETQSQYRQNQALSIELLDAFTQLINSQLEVELNKTDILIKQAEVEKATASYNL